MSSNTLQEFLNAHPIDDLTDEVIISDRFKDAEGNILKFTIKAMSNREFEDVRKKSMIVKKGRRVEMDVQKFNNSIAVNNTIVPSFKDAESIKKTGCLEPEEYLEKVLLSGEIAELVTQIQKLSGFDRDINEMIEEAKN